MDQTLLLGFEALEEAHWWFIVRRRLVIEWVRRWVPDDAAHILEIGCGTGGTLRRLQEIFPASLVTGIEPVEAAVAASRSRGCDVVVATMEELPDPDESVDAILGLDVIEHLQDDMAGLREARRVLKSGGRLLITAPALPSLWGPHDVANAHYRRYTKRTLLEVIHNAGFVVERASYFNSILLPAGWIERRITRLLRLRSSPGLNQPAPIVNSLMMGLFALEIPILRRIDLPIGMSLVLVATKP